MNEPQSAGREMTWSERKIGRARHWLRRLRRKLPYLVWHGDELDVRVTLRGDTDLLFAAQTPLRDLGISFDTGMGNGGRDWEWDFSLQGPISVRFGGRAKYPERRHARPKPQLVVNNEAA